MATSCPQTLRAWRGAAVSPAPRAFVPPAPPSAPAEHAEVFLLAHAACPERSVRAGSSALPVPRPRRRARAG